MLPGSMLWALAVARARALVRGGTPCRRAPPANLASGGTTVHTTILHSDPAEFQGGGPFYLTEMNPRLSTVPPPRTVRRGRRLRRTCPSITSCVSCPALGFEAWKGQADLSWAPSGSRPSLTNRHKAMSNFLASATVRTLRMRPLDPPSRSCNHLARALPG